MSAFDDLMNLGGDTSGNINQSADIFGTSQSTESSGGALLDFGFDAQISANNGPSGKVNLEANTNPLYEFNNTQDIMATESSNPMYEFNTEPQKEVKSDSSNPLYDFMQSENTNGHSEDAIITNGNSNEVDLLGGNNVDLLGGGNPVDSVDLLGGSGNIADLLQVESGDTGDTADLLGGNSGTVTSDDSGVTVDTNLDLQGEVDISGEVTQERSRSNSEGSEPEQEDVKKTEQPAPVQTETRNSEQEENGVKVNGTSDVKENGVTEDEAVHFAEMSNVRQKFESGKVSEDEPTPRKVSLHEEFGEGGEYESTPVQNPDVVRETDNIGEELPEVGSAKSLVDKFKTISEEKFEKAKRDSPPREGKVEYESQPSEHLEQYEGKSDTGVFESNPSAPEDVVRSGDTVEDVKPESGTTKNIMNKFKDIQTENSAVKTHEKREITPDRSGKVEYVSEPRGEKIEYTEAPSESGVFENTPKEEEGVVRALDKNEEVMPESGITGSILSKFKQMESETGNKPPPSPGRREITPDRSGKVEFVSEPRGFLEKYEQKEDAGVFESQPTVSTEVVRSGDSTEDVKPEAGSAMKAMEMFKEIQKQSSSPVHSNRKEITPPRETSPGRTVAGVVESTPQMRDDVVRNADTVQDELPEQGSAKNILNKFKEIQSGSPTNTPSRKQKEFTPPPEAGVYENTPSEHLVVETRQSESGVLESTPSKSTADIARERDSVSPEAEQPEHGMAKNLVSKFRQLESSAKNSTSPSPRFKEFTPPRDRGPLSPKSPAGTTNGVQPSDLPGQYQQQDSPGIFENEPEVKGDVYREGDRDETEELPKANTTMSMLQKFKSMQQQAVDEQNTPPPISRKGKNVQHE